MSKTTDFRARVDQIGETLTHYAFSGYATGDYINEPWNAPDPESPDYPASGSLPGIVYYDPVSVDGIIQPLTIQEGRRHLVADPHGNRTAAQWRVYLDDQVENLTEKSKFTLRGKDYWAATEEWREGDTLVYTKVYLSDKINS